MEIVSFAELFKGDCTIKLLFDKGEINLQSLISTSSQGFKGQQHGTLVVEGIGEGLVVELMRVFLENFHLLSQHYGLETSKHSAHCQTTQNNQLTLTPEIDIYSSYKTMYELLAGVLDLFDGSMKVSYISRLQHHLLKYQVNATLNSKHGLHILSTGILRDVAEQYGSVVTLSFVSADNLAKSCRITDWFTLMSMQIPFKTIITVKAEGPDCEISARAIADMLQQMDEVEKYIKENCRHSSHEEIARAVITEFSRE